MLDEKKLEKFNNEQRNLILNINKRSTQISSLFHERLLDSLEKETVYLRQIISMCPNEFRRRGFFPRNRYEIIINSEEVNGQVRYIIELPFLLGNRRNPLTNFKRTIASDTHTDVLNFYREKNPKMIENASVTFINYYAPSVHRRLRHDNDNTEISSILNILTGFLIPDDSCLCCDLHILSREAEKSYTKVIVEERKGIDEQ